MVRTVREGPEVFVMNIDGSLTRQLSFSGGSALINAWAPDGSAVYWSAQTDSFSVYRTPVDGSSTGAPLLRMAEQAHVHDVSADGKRLLLSIWRMADLLDIEEFDVETGRLRKIAGGPGIQIGPYYSQDQAWIAYFSLMGSKMDLFICSAERPEQRWKLATEFAAATGMNWVEGGSALLVADGEGVVRVPVSFPNGYPQFGAVERIYSFAFPVLNAGGVSSFDASGRHALLLEVESDDVDQIRMHLRTNFEKLLESVH